jgi:copper chaperone CopZ
MMKTTGFFMFVMTMLFVVSMSVSAQDKDKKEDKKEQTEKKASKKKKAEEVTFEVNMTCGNCQAKIERHISWEKGVKDLKVNLDKKQVTIKYDPQKTDAATLKKAIEGLEFTCELPEE